MKEFRMFYGDYKKVKNYLPMDHYDETTKEAVFYLDNCKKYVAVNKDAEEFIFYVVDIFDRKFPNADPLSRTFLVKNGSKKQDLMLYSFSNKLNKGTINEWKYLVSAEDVTPEEFLEALKTNKFY